MVGREMKRRFISITLLFIALFWLVQARSSGAAQDEPRQIVITAKKFAYEPNEITLKKGEPVEFVFKGKDASHGLRASELNLDLQVSKGGTVKAQVTPDRIGEFSGQCSIFCGMGHGGMVIKIHVVD